MWRVNPKLQTDQSKCWLYQAEVFFLSRLNNFCPLGLVSPVRSGCGDMVSLIDYLKFSFIWGSFSVHECCLALNSEGTQAWNFNYYLSRDLLFELLWCRSEERSQRQQWLKKGISGKSGSYRLSSCAARVDVILLDSFPAATWPETECREESINTLLKKKPVPHGWATWNSHWAYK